MQAIDESDRIVPGGLSPRTWRIYVHVWLGCLVFPIASLLQNMPPAPRLAIAIGGLVVYVAFYVWFMRGNPPDDADGTRRLAPGVLPAIVLITLLALYLAASFGTAFLWLFVGPSIVAGRKLPMGRAHLVTAVLPLLAIAAGIPTPKCYVIDDTAPNAFAAGRKPETAVICVTTGILEKLNRVELEGVIAHEMSHIKNFDILQAAWDKLPAGSLILAHNSGNSAEKLQHYLAFVRDPRNCAASVNVLLDIEGLEVTKK